MLHTVTMLTLYAYCAYLAHFFTWCAQSMDGVHCVPKSLFEIRVKCEELAEGALIARNAIPHNQYAHCQCVDTGHT
jgi:hypothetical protein